MANRNLLIVLLLSAATTAAAQPPRPEVRAYRLTEAESIIIDGAPFWGSDVGGILSMVPAFGITAAARPEAARLWGAARRNHALLAAVVFAVAGGLLLERTARRLGGLRDLGERNRVEQHLRAAGGVAAERPQRHSLRAGVGRASSDDQCAEGRNERHRPASGTVTAEAAAADFATRTIAFPPAA